MSDLSSRQKQILHIAERLDRLDDEQWDDLKLFFPNVFSRYYSPTRIQVAVKAVSHPHLRSELNKVLQRRWPMAAFQKGQRSAHRKSRS